MNRLRFAAFAILALGVVLVGGFFVRDPEVVTVAPTLDMAETNAALSPLQSNASLPVESPTGHERVSISEPIDWSNLRRKLEEMAPRLAEVKAQREANRLLQHWLRSDRNAALTWLSAHRGDPRFDPIAASVAQTLVAVGDFGEAQNLADGIVDPAVGDWAHQEAWAAAYEQGLVTAEQIQRSGLPAAAIGSVLSGSHRD